MKIKKIMRNTGSNDSVAKNCSTQKPIQKNFESEIYVDVGGRVSVALSFLKTPSV